MEFKVDLHLVAVQNHRHKISTADQFQPTEHKSRILQRLQFQIESHKSAKQIQNFMTTKPILTSLKVEYHVRI